MQEMFATGKYFKSAKQNKEVNTYCYFKWSLRSLNRQRLVEVIERLPVEQLAYGKTLEVIASNIIAEQNITF